MTLPEMHAHCPVLLDAVSGSHAQNLATETSDVDRRGVFLLPRERYFSWDRVTQVSDARNDEVYYELDRFLELLAQSNPNALELLCTPPLHLRARHPLIAEIDVRKLLSKRCEKSFGGFAVAQIRKARGLNKKIRNPMEKRRKTPLEFCWVQVGNGARPLVQWMEERSMGEGACGLVRIPHMQDLYGLYHDPKAGYAGLLKKEQSNALALSSVAKDAPLLATVYFHQNGYSQYCKDHREYWEWVDNRNEERYASTAAHGRGYDAKNMMHVFRLLNMAIEIAEEGRLNVHRPDREFLLSVKRGEYAYADLLERAEALQKRMERAYAGSGLPAGPDVGYLRGLGVAVRTAVYGAGRG